MIPADVAAFRETFQREHIPRNYSGMLHILLTVGASAIVVLYCLFHLHEVRLLEWLTIPVTFLYANMTEYFTHRVLMHYPVPGLKRVFVGHTLEHHHYFTDESMELDGIRALAVILFPPLMLALFVGIFAFPVAFLVGYLISPNSGYLFLAVAMGYYANYELFHLAYHMPENSRVGRLPFMKRLRQFHTRHHDLRWMSRYCFNITYPIGDLIFGTMPRKPAPKEVSKPKDRTTFPAS